MNKLKNFGRLAAAALFVVTGMLAVLPSVVSAADTNVDVTLTTGANCTPLVNGVAATYVNVAPGQSVNVSITNNSSSTQAVTISQAGEPDFRF